MKYVPSRVLQKKKKKKKITLNHIPSGGNFVKAELLQEHCRVKT